MRTLKDFRKEIFRTGLTQNQNLRGHHADPLFTDAAIVQLIPSQQLWQLHTDLLPITLSFGAMIRSIVSYAARDAQVTAAVLEQSDPI